MVRLIGNPFQQFLFDMPYDNGFPKDGSVFQTL